MPNWLIQILVQYPIVVIVGLVAWYASRRIEKVLEARALRAEQLQDATVAGLKDVSRQVIDEISKEVADLKTELRDEFKKLGKKVDELNRRLSP